MVSDSKIWIVVGRQITPQARERKRAMQLNYYTIVLLDHIDLIRHIAFVGEGWFGDCMLSIEQFCCFLTAAYDFVAAYYVMYCSCAYMYNTQHCLVSVALCHGRVGRSDTTASPAVSPVRRWLATPLSNQKPLARSLSTQSVRQQWTHAHRTSDATHTATKLHRQSDVATELITDATQ